MDAAQAAGYSYETDFGPFTATGEIIRSTAKAHSGVYSVRSASSTTGWTARLYKPATFPASGTIVLTNWFSRETPPGTSVGEFPLLACSVDAAVSAWQGFCVFLGYSGVQYRTTTPAAAVTLYSYLNISTGWYKIQVVVNLTANQFSVYLFASDGVTLLASALNIGMATALAGTTKFLYVGGAYQASSGDIYVDDTDIGAL